MIATTLAAVFAVLSVSQAAPPGAPGTPAAHEAAQSRPASRAEAFAALETRRIADGHGPETAKKFAPEYLEFAKKNAGTDEALEAKLWLLQQTWWEREAGTMGASAKKMVSEILAEYPKGAPLAKIADYHYCFDPADERAILESLLEREPAVVRASALFALGTSELRARDAATKQRGRERFELLSRDYAKIPCKYTTYGAMADASLAPHAPGDLVKGKPAPEIVGNDASGKAIKLSDFRGKVVMLDFWGFW